MCGGLYFSAWRLNGPLNSAFMFDPRRPGDAQNTRLSGVAMRAIRLDLSARNPP